MKLGLTTTCSIDIHFFSFYREGSLRKGDEVLMINSKSVVGFRVSDVVNLLKEAGDEVTIIAAAKVFYRK